MTSVGRAFGFYIKYWQQMEALTNADKKDSKALLKSLPEEARGMIEPVKKRAGEQAADFLNKCGEDIEDHFVKLGNARTKITSRQSSIETGWGIKVRLWEKGKKPGRYRWETGLWFEELGGSPVLVLYVWVRGGRVAEQKLARIFGDSVHYRSSDFSDWGAGSVIIGEKIDIRVSDKNTFEIDGDKLREQVRVSLKQISRGDVKKLFEIPAI